MRKLLLLVTMLLPVVSLAGTADLSFVYATKNTDGSVIPTTCTATPCGKITKGTIEYGTCSGPNIFGTKQGEIALVPPVAAATVSLIVVQTYCFRASNTNDYGVLSSFSNVASKANAPPTPEAPASLIVAVTTVFQVIPAQGGRFAFNPVGTVPPSTQCDPTQTVNGMYAVPREAVTWFGATRPQVVVSKCS